MSKCGVVRMAACLGLSCMIPILEPEKCLYSLAFELCFSFRNWAMFRTHKWGYVSVAEMGLCFRYRNGAMFQLQKWCYV